MYDQILDALRRGATDEALNAARVAVSANPDDVQAHRWMAAALQASGDSQAAFDSLGRALALAPDDADLHYQRAGFLLGEHKLDEAQEALARSIGLDPNQFEAYVMQAQLALGRGDLGEAERQQRLAARIAPEHPWLKAIEGTLLLRRGDGDGAIALLSRAAEEAPEDAQVRYALGFAYLQQGHHAFAEQAFRGIVEKHADAHGLRGLIADLLRRQGRYADAADELAPLLADPATSTPGLQRFAGELELVAGRGDRALPWLRSVLAAHPGDRRTLGAIIEAWRQSGDFDDARSTLDAALSASAQSVDLWRARLAFEPVAGESARAVIDRWLEANPDSMAALEAKLALHTMLGERAAADALAEQIIAIEPGRSSAETQLITSKLERDPAAAIVHLDELIARAGATQNQRLLRAWRGLALDRAGRVDDAAATWTALQAEVADERLPLPEPAAPPTLWPDMAEKADDAAPVAFLWGVPGSGVERLASLLDGKLQGFRADRFGHQPPADTLQNYPTPRALQQGTLTGLELIDDWRATLGQRGVEDGQIVDWLVWWDNALLLALRPHLPEALLIFALRDPRDMLLDWLAFGAPAPFAMKSPKAAAGWLSIVLNQVALLHEQNLFPHKLVKLDDVFNDALALNDALSEVLETPLPAPDPSAIGPMRFASGHWRDYAQALAEPFAALTPVAKRLGYPER